jgi:hypothetical protein
LASRYLFQPASAETGIPVYGGPDAACLRETPVRMPLLNLRLKVVSFVLAFSAAFAIGRFSPLVSLGVLQRNRAGIGWLYPTIGLVFGIVSAFTILIL